MQMFNSASLLPPLPPPSRSLRVSLMDATCLSRGEMRMHHIPFFFKARPLTKVTLTLTHIILAIRPHPFSCKDGPNGSAAHQAAALFVEQPS